MPTELIDKVKDEVPDYVGIIENGRVVVKNPKRQELKVSEDILYYSLFKSLYRDAEKYQKIQNSKDIDALETLRKQKNTEIAKLKKQWQKYKDDVHSLNRRVFESNEMIRFLKQRAKPEDLEEMYTYMEKYNKLKF